MLSFAVGVTIGVAVALSVAVLVALVLLHWRRQLDSSSPSNNKSEQLQQQEMEWDNSTFNITVNPLDQEDAFDDEKELGGLPPAAVDEEDDEECADDGCSLDELDIEAAVQTKVDRAHGTCKELEWDDSTLSF